MHTLIEKLQTSLSELKLVRGRLVDLHAKDLKAIYHLLQDIVKADVHQEATALLKKTIAEQRELHIINYHLALLMYLTQQNGDNYLSIFYNYLSKIGKIALIELISEQVLAHYESLFVYTSMAQQAERSDNKEALIPILKNLLARNPDDIITAKKLAKLHIDTDNVAVHHYYDIALSRSFDKSDFGEACSIWKLLVTLEPENVDYLINWAKKLSQHTDANNGYELFSSLLKSQKNNLNNSNPSIIKIIKAGLETQVVLWSQFFLIIRAYKEVYASHKYLNDFLNLSKLPKLIKSKKSNHSSEVLLSYINKFEKIIKLDQGSFVHHKAFGLGMISQLKKDTPLSSIKTSEPKFICSFIKKRNHAMSLDIALKSLTPCYENHVVGLKLFKPEEFNTLLTAPIAHFTKEVMLTLEKPATQKEIHDLLVPTLFNEEQWSRKWKEMKKVFFNHPDLEYINKMYALAKKDFDLDTRTTQALKQTTKSSQKIKTIEAYFIHQKNISDAVITTIGAELTAIVTAEPNLALFTTIFIQYLNERYKITIPISKPINFADHYTQANFIASYNFATSQHIRNLLLEKLETTLPEATYHNDLEKLITANTLQYRDLVFERLIKLPNKTVFKKICRKISDQYLDFREVYLIMVTYLLEKQFPAGFDSEGLTLYKMVRLLGELNRLIAIEKDIILSKRLYTTINRILFEQNVLSDYLTSETNENTILPGDDITKLAHKERIFKELEKQPFHNETRKIELSTLREKIRHRNTPS
ncbi:hypothetical protein COTS27_00764 [Spirochaetota bacterium]|nr:hypothetical protein COTS27_00764 [Spirochaetota bacterium]